MPMVGVDRRSFLKTMGSAGFSTALPASALAGSPFAGKWEFLRSSPSPFVRGSKPHKT